MLYNQLMNTPFSTLKVSGPDAMHFLQGQLTCDMREMLPMMHQWGAFCNRQGRVLALMDVFRMEDDYFLTLPQEIMATIYQELKKYIVFSKVTIDDVTQDYPRQQSPEFLLTQMRELIPFIGQAQSGKFLPHPLGLVKLGAISFKKGCFVGQEIIARMQHRATLKKELQYFEIHCNQIPAVGDEISWDEYHKGILVNALLIGEKTCAILVITQ